MTVKNLMGRWPSRKEFANDIGITYSHANVIAMRDSINSRYWGKIVAAAKRRGIRGVTFVELTKLATRIRSAA